MTIVIPRSVWEPRHDNGVTWIGTSAWLAAGKELWLHHSTTTPYGPDATLEQDCEHMRAFEAIGENRFGAGISYTWVVMPSGRVFQGHDIDRQGTHTYQRNDRSRGICLAGNYDNKPLPDNMARSVAHLLIELGATLDGGHRNVYATACPGEYAYARIGQINNWATTGNIPGDDDMPDLSNMHVTVTNSPDAPYKETADIALGATTGNVRSLRAEVATLTQLVVDLTSKVDAISTGGVSEERIAEIAVDAVDDKLGDNA